MGRILSQETILIQTLIKIRKELKVQGVEEEEPEAKVEVVVEDEEGGGVEEKLSLKVNNQRKKVKMNHLHHVKRHQQRNLSARKKNQHQNQAQDQNQKRMLNPKMERRN